MTQERPLNFETAQQRQEWIIKHAEYFTTCRTISTRTSKERTRNEHSSLEDARGHAKVMLAENPKPVLIYAVSGNSDTYIEMVK